MIKFIACDLDGTLLNSSKELPRDLRATVERLNKIGVTFAPASGRQYYKVLEQFEPISRNFMYIAENGAFVIKDGEVIVRDCLSGAVALDVIKRTRKLPSVYPILCCEDCAYMESSVGGYKPVEVGQYFRRLEFVPDLTDYCDTKNILKVAVYTPNDAYENIYKKLPEYPESAQIILSGREWVDVMKIGVSKGSAIKKVREICGWDKSECMCFGDYLNDYEMMFECGESFAMANAHEDLKKAAKHIAPSNDENVVMKSIQKWFGL